jgi:hypothetical protein
LMSNQLLLETGLKLPTQHFSVFRILLSQPSQTLANLELSLSQRFRNTSCHVMKFHSLNTTAIIPLFGMKTVLRWRKSMDDGRMNLA